MIGFLSCNDKKPKNTIVPSIGKINSLTIIINDILWSGEIGDSLRKKFAAPVDGLPQEEPLFTINQYPTKALDGTKVNNRNIIIVKKEERNNFEIIQNEFAKPQNVVHISGKTTTEILDYIQKNALQLVKLFKETEVIANQKSIVKSTISDKTLKRKFKIRLSIPSTYKYVVIKPNFVWMKKEILAGSNSVLVYSVPFKCILKNNDVVKNIILMRDSIEGNYIHSKVRNSRMATEVSYLPYFEKIVLDSKRTYETKGTWELKGDFMSGAFVNYAIIDRKRKRFVIVEGFCYAPSTEKRDLMFELEAIIKTIKVL
jgi:Domain of unknown function (DUF4837)